MKRLGLFGAGGRMGRRVEACLAAHPTLSLQTRIGHGATGDFRGCDVVIDFSVASATKALLDRLDGAALVSGVTGRAPAQQAAVAAYAERAPVFVAANFSLGVAVLSRLVHDAARMLGAGFQAEVFEIHHDKKADAPSGTALHLAQAAARGQGLSWPDGRAPVRDGQTGARGDHEVGLAALRGGRVVGEHTVFFFGAAERLELVHRATDRDVFAHGALHAATWVTERPPRVYGLDDLLTETFR